jgi:hypothetical protein
MLNAQVSFVVAWMVGLVAIGHSAEAREHCVPVRHLGAARGNFLRHIRILSSDEFEGRSPGSHGEQLTVDYIEGQFKALGLSPGNPDGSYTQAVPLSRFRAQPKAAFKVGARALEARVPDDFIAYSSVRQAEFDIAVSQLVFVGYGATAPEYDWNDYAGVDVSGKTLVMLVNDPPVLLAAESTFPQWNADAEFQRNAR